MASGFIQNQCPRYTGDTGSGIFRMSNLIIQWKQVNAVPHIAVDGTYTPTQVTWPIAFPHECFAAFGINCQLGFSAQDTVAVGYLTTTGCKLSQSNSLSINTTMHIRVIAIGY